MMDISFQQMQYLLEISKTGSISQAAKNLYINQPNLSKMVKDLEDSLGVALFRRSPQGVTPTPEGALFLDSASDIVEKIHRLNEKVKKIKSRYNTFHISIPRASYITYAFTKFISALPDTEEIRMNYQETNTMETVENLLHQGFDLGIIRYPVFFEHDFLLSLKKKDLLTREIWEFDYMLLMSKQNPLAAKEQLVLDDLDGCTELVHGDIYVPFIPKKAYNRTNPSGDKNRRIYLYDRGSQFDLLRNMTTTYMWGSPLPLETRNIYQLTHRRCSDHLTRFKDILVYRSDYQFTAYAIQFLDVLFDVVKSIQENPE